MVLANQDSVEHDISVTHIAVKVHQAGHGGGHGTGGKGPALHVHAEAGTSEAVEFTPTEAGTYEFYCTVSGHKEAGMIGRLVVK